MNKTKRILAWIGIILLVGLYLSTLIFSLMNSDLAYDLFRISVACTIIIPVLLYGMILAHRLLSKKNEENVPDKK